MKKFKRYDEIYVSPEQPSSKLKADIIALLETKYKITYSFRNQVKIEDGPVSVSINFVGGEASGLAY